MSLNIRHLVLPALLTFSCATTPAANNAPTGPSTVDAPEAAPAMTNTNLSVKDEVPVPSAEISKEEVHHHEENPAGVYSCPMHPEVRSDSPGQCPKCGMNLTVTAAQVTPAPPALKPVAPAPKKPAVESYFTCPMHPEIHSATPGRCPKCGMNLVKSTKAHSK